MGTTIRPNISPKNKYYIEKHRYYELKHFCMQYPIWRKAYSSLSSLSGRPSDLGLFKKQYGICDPTAKCAEARLFYAYRIDMIEQAAMETDSVLADYILTAVTEGISYDVLKARLNIPCCRDTYYQLYRRFFWILNKLRQ